MTSLQARTIVVASLAAIGLIGQFPRALAQEPCEAAKLLAHDGAAGDWLGTSVALYGDTALVGAPGDDDCGSSSGSAYVFQKVADVWTHVGKLTPSDGDLGGG
jgi:hypothetical protein